MNYLVDGLHPNHVEYDLSAFKSYSELNSQNFLERAEWALSHINRPKKKGRKLETIAHYYVFRFVDGTDLSGEECDFYETEMVRLGMSSALVISNRHHNVETVGTDFNFLQAGWMGEPPRSLRTNEDDLLKRMRRASNSLIEVLNVERKKRALPYIIGVLDVMRVRARIRRISTIEDDIIKAKKTQEVTAENLPEILATFGHEVVNTSKDGETISVIRRGKKKPIRVNVDDLLESAYSEQRAVIDEQIKQLTIETRRDQTVDDILEIESNEAASRPQGRGRR